MDQVGMTVGVEEEFHILNPETGRLAPASRQIMEEAPVEAAERVNTAQQEFKRSMIETATPICETIDEVRSALIASRSSLISSADRLGLWIAAAGTVPDSGISNAPVYPDDRYRRISDEYRQLATEQQVCACQVQVGVPDRDLAIRLIPRLRGWLPPLLALTAGSPFFQSNDTGYASYRSIVVSRWPTAGPMPVFKDYADYRLRVDRLIEAGVIGDYGMIYYDVRPSHRYPTLEIRIADACPSLEDVVLVSALARALVVTAAAEEAAGKAPAAVTDELVRGATWRAARSGLRGQLVDPVAGESVSAPDLVRRLVKHVGDALDEMGDRDYVVGAVDALLRRGSSAQRQRRALGQGAGMTGVVAAVVAETREGLTL
ncbi:carboxylate-amine ligase [Allocatelliglobosispora scoriae]|uniref:Putative glutamate--cysteine ligase 2 n=1 Tax=Allocatelliglobosispora scoriae TaxID=643052 RepID=A0A841BJW4_9ACTN|nr:glutamate--cysteine ligase [Allocatelliglobosispora scoriae]MBB5867628.1 carboxylate-amine ligase [Allocatelliglobosispora scoriae]